MPENYWKGPLAFAVLGISILIVSCWLAWDFSAEHTEIRVKKTDIGANFLLPSQDQLDQACGDYKSRELQLCIQRLVEKRREFLVSEWDLDAQQQMAFFTRLMGYTAIAGIVIGFGSAILIYATLRATQQMTSDSQAVGNAQSRAWLSIDCSLAPHSISESTQGRRGIYLNALPKLQNHGRSPATNVSFHADVKILNSESGTPDEMLRKFCAEISSQNKFFAEAIFPGSRSDLSHNAVLWLDDIEIELEHKSFKAFSAYLLTCTTYQCGYSQKIHQTQAAYMLANHEAGSPKVMGPYQDDWLERPISLVHPGLIFVN